MPRKQLAMQALQEVTQDHEVRCSVPNCSGSSVLLSPEEAWHERFEFEWEVGKNCAT